MTESPCTSFNDRNLVFHGITSPIRLLPLSLLSFCDNTQIYHNQ